MKPKSRAITAAPHPFAALPVWMEGTIADKPLPGKKSGLNVRVGGKSIGKPHLFGLENDDALSDRLRRRIVGEINLPADSLELTAAGGDVVESDKGFEMLMQAILLLSWKASSPSSNRKA